MNKLLKGAVAGAAGVALLLGGAGTFALWNSTANVEVGAINSGTLSIAASTAAEVWTDHSADGPVAGTPIASIEGYKIVPGDTLTMTKTLLVSASGNNLEAALSFDPTSITTVTPEDEALKNELQFDLSATAADGSPLVANADNTLQIAQSRGEQSVTVTLTVDFPSTVTGTVGQNGAVDLSALGFTLDQVRS